MMKQLIDFFTPREILHIVAISNRLKILSTEEKKYLVAVRMGAQRKEDGWDIGIEEKEKFNPVFSRFMNHYPEDFLCTKEHCPACMRFSALKQDFTGQRESKEYEILMAWVSRGQTHYTGPSEKPMERFSTEMPPEDVGEKTLEAGPDKGKVKRFKVVARKTKLDRSEPKEKEAKEKEAAHPFLELIRELSQAELEAMEQDDLMAYGRQSRELFSKILYLWDQLADTGSLLQGFPVSASSRT